MRRAGNGTVGSNPTLSAIHLAHLAQVGRMPHKCPQTGPISARIGPDRITLSRQYPLFGVVQAAHSLLAMQPVTFPCLTGNLERICLINKRSGRAISLRCDIKSRSYRGLTPINNQTLLIGRTGYLIGPNRDVDRRKQALSPENRKRDQSRRQAQSACSFQSSGNSPRTIFSRVRVDGCRPSIIAAWSAGDRNASRARRRS